MWSLLRSPVCGSHGFPVAIRAMKEGASIPNYNSFPVISEVELRSLGCPSVWTDRMCPSVSCYPSGRSCSSWLPARHRLAHFPPPVCLRHLATHPFVFITVILLDHIPQDATAAWRMYATFLSGCFRVAQGKMEKHVFLQVSGSGAPVIAYVLFL